MFLPRRGYLDRLGEFVLKLAIPHQINKHRPLALQSKGLFVFLVVLLISQATANLTSGSGQVLGFATNISTPEIIRLTNVERANAGLGQLKENSALDKAAELKANDMFNKDYWAHFAPDGTSPWYFFGLVSYQYSWAGENLARDFATSGGVVAAWMASSGHRANILNSNFTEIGVAVVNGNLEGEDTTLVVQLFGKPVALASAAPEGNTAGTTSQGAKLEANLNTPTSTGEPSQVTPKPATEEKKVEALPQESTGSKVVAIQSLFKNATASQKVTLSLLLLVALLFIIDSVVIFRRRHMRIGSHSLVHASLIILLAVATLLYGQGSIL
jgi:hypothetical protein